MTRRRLLGTGAAMAAALPLSGCATATITARNDTHGNGGKQTLRFGCLAFEAGTIKATQAIVAAWNQAHPDVQVEYVQGSWDSVQNQLVTQFMGGTAPDIIQYESAEMRQFAEQGYLADLAPYLSDDLRSTVPDSMWQTVTVGGKLIAAPTLVQTYLVFANVGLLRQAGVTVPTGATWAWDDFMAAAGTATSGGTFGLGWGLAQPVATMLSMGEQFGATYFQGTGNDATIRIGAAEQALPGRIHQMAYQDKSLDPVSLTQDGGAVMTGFLKGRYAMTVQGSYTAQTLVQEAPDGFEWAVLPTLADVSPNQAASPQTLSVSAQSDDIVDSAAFVDFYMRAQNLAQVAQGDWLIPASTGASAAVLSDTGGKDGWDVILASGEHLVAAPYQTATAFPQWQDQIATPAYQRYFGDEISADQLAEQLTSGWTSVS